MAWRSTEPASSKIQPCWLLGNGDGDGDGRVSKIRRVKTLEIGTAYANTQLNNFHAQTLCFSKHTLLKQIQQKGERPTLTNSSIFCPTPQKKHKEDVWPERVNQNFSRNIPPNAYVNEIDILTDECRVM